MCIRLYGTVHIFPAVWWVSSWLSLLILTNKWCSYVHLHTHRDKPMNQSKFSLNHIHTSRTQVVTLTYTGNTLVLIIHRIGLLLYTEYYRSFILICVSRTQWHWPFQWWIWVYMSRRNLQRAPLSGLKSATQHTWIHKHKTHIYIHIHTNLVAKIVFNRVRYSTGHFLQMSRDFSSWSNWRKMTYIITINDKGHFPPCTD
jgi:hypothetical protein